jgi:carbon-monoxide dehydrogenase small subunit
MCDGRAIQTVEGTRGDPAMDVIRRHFHEAHGLQCGFCTSGMLMAARDILRRHKAPDETTIRKELSGHICRCTGYVGIVEAIRSAGVELSGRR